jgi:hypothetical protein
VDKVIYFIFVVTIGLGIDLLLAQITDFGLSQFHIQAGIAGPWLLIIVTSGIISPAVGTAIRSNK